MNTNSRSIARNGLLGLITATCLNLLLATAAFAQDMGPDVLIKTVTAEVLEIVRKDKDIQSGNTKKAIELIETKVLPHFNFTRMTQLAIGQNWKKATPEQQKALTDEFRTLMVRTYSNALTGYKNQTIEFKDFKMKPTDTEVTVRSQIEQAGAKALGLEYFLEKTGSAWKVTDIAVAGISLVTNYRDSFSVEIRQNGVDGLIKALQAKNKSTESMASAKK